MFTSMIVRAHAVQPDDRFKFGGSMYRCTKKDYNAFGGVIITARIMKRKKLGKSVTLIVDRNIPVKIYNQ